MIRGSEHRKAGHPIDTLFLDRWSPRAMSGEELTEAELLTLFEAARWAPSSYNNQPWRMLYARRGTAHWTLFFELLVDFNKTWAKNAAVLVLFISKTTFDHNGEPSVTHSFDTGAAWQNLALQATLRNLAVHAMEGFNFRKASFVLKAPGDLAIEPMVATGKTRKKEFPPNVHQKRETPCDRRKLTELVKEGPWL